MKSPLVAMLTAGVLLAIPVFADEFSDKFQEAQRLRGGASPKGGVSEPPGKAVSAPYSFEDQMKERDEILRIYGFQSPEEVDEFIGVRIRLWRKLGKWEDNNPDVLRALSQDLIRRGKSERTRDSILEDLHEAQKLGKAMRDVLERDHGLPGMYYRERCLPVKSKGSQSDCVEHMYVLHLIDVQGSNTQGLQGQYEEVRAERLRYQLLGRGKEYALKEAESLPKDWAVVDQRRDGNTTVTRVQAHISGDLPQEYKDAISKCQQEMIDNGSTRGFSTAISPQHAAGLLQEQGRVNLRACLRNEACEKQEIKRMTSAHCPSVR